MALQPATEFRALTAQSFKARLGQEIGLTRCGHTEPIAAGIRDQAGLQDRSRADQAVGGNFFAIVGGAWSSQTQDGIHDPERARSFFVLQLNWLAELQLEGLEQLEPGLEHFRVHLLKRSKSSQGCRGKHQIR